MADQIIFGPWSGAVTSSTATVKAAVALDASVQLLYSSRLDGSGNLADPAALKPNPISGSDIKVVTFNIDNLQADTLYHYALEVDGAVAAAKRGRFKTFPTEDQPASFKFVCAGDAETGSNDRVFDFIRAEEPLFFCHLGDLHYSNVHRADSRKYREAYRKVLNAERQANLYRNIPIAYTWDDHDYDNNDANRTAPGRRVARLTYQECVPHYPLVEGKGDVAIYQAFTVGRVRFLLSDVRSERSPRDEEDDADKTMLGARQKRWLIDELRRGKDKYALVVWISSVPWIGRRKSLSDSWFGFATERDEIGGIIEDEGISNVCMLAADAHMLAIDDGSHNTGEFGRGRFPVFQAAPLDSTRSAKGGPYTFGPLIDDTGQYGVFTVEDAGGPTVRVSWEGKNVNEGRTLMSFSFTSPR